MHPLRPSLIDRHKSRNHFMQGTESPRSAKPGMAWRHRSLTCRIADRVKHSGQWSAGAPPTLREPSLFRQYRLCLCGVRCACLECGEPHTQRLLPSPRLPLHGYASSSGVAAPCRCRHLGRDRPLPHASSAGRCPWCASANSIHRKDTGFQSPQFPLFFPDSISQTP